MNGRGMSKVLRCSDCALQIVTRLSQIQRRTFANSSIRQKYGAVPAFTDVSSPELLNILTTLRERLVLPSHLSKYQKSLIYKTKYHNSLISEPATARIAGEDFPLRPIDRTRDIPNVRKSLFKAIGLMETKSDWDNLPRLLEGLKQAGTKLEPWVYEKIVRLAGSAGRQDVVLECVRQGPATGFVLKSPGLVQQVAWWFQMKAVESDFDAKTTLKALSWTEMVFELMEDPSHALKPFKAAGLDRVDPKHQPDVVGVLLQLAAVRASKHMGGIDEDGRVREYAEKLFGTSMEFGSPQERKPKETFGFINRWLANTVPVLHGMRVALTVLDPTSAAAKMIQAKIPQLESDVSRYKDALSAQSSEPGTLVGLKLHQKLLAEASWNLGGV